MKYLAANSINEAKALAHRMVFENGERRQRVYPEKMVFQPDGAIGVDDSDAPSWAAGQDVKAAEVRTHNGKSYICIQPHRTQSDWSPERVPALWKELRNTTADNPDPWVQPQGAHDAYELGAIVTHNGKTWKNTGSNANVWEPGVYGWEEV